MRDGFLPHAMRDDGFAAAPHARGSLAQPLSIAFVNNMPDAALRAAERNFCRLLGAASEGMYVTIRFYTLPGVARAGAARDHVACCYEDWRALERDRPDGIIVTGAEPTTLRLQDESFWPAMAQLIDWAEDAAVPGIWSCLAAHAAVLHVDGVARTAQKRKLSGVFPCTINSGKHQILHRLPRRIQVPHSRRHGLERAALEAQGYTILSTSRAAGVDMFMKQASAMQLFLHGHPEYEHRTLLSEYRRDVLRAACTAGAEPPEPPEGLGDNGLRADLRTQARRIVRRETDSMSMVDALLQRITTPAWLAAPAEHLFANWLAYLDGRRASTHGGRELTNDRRLQAVVATVDPVPQLV